MIAAALGRIRQFGASLFGRGQHQSLVPQPAPLPSVTDWFPPEIDPVYVGFYQRKYDEGDEHDIGVCNPDYWDGAVWMFACDGTVGKVSENRLPWRGLTNPADVVIPGEGK